MVEPARRQKVFTEHWSLFLRCTICLGYLQEPHTLTCGHTFCSRCLKKLAEVTREENPDIATRKLSLSCPSCRHVIPAKKILHSKICTCIVLKQLLELWKKETLLLATSTICPLRTISIQKCLDGDPHVLEVSDLIEKDKECPGHLQDYIDILMQRVSEAKDEFDLDCQEISQLKLPLSEADTVRQRGNLSNDGDSSGNSEYESSTSVSGASVPDIYSRMNLPRLTFTDCSPGRFLLMIIWSVYAVIIVGLAEAFLPYIILFTLFFFLIVLK